VGTVIPMTWRGWRTGEASKRPVRTCRDPPDYLIATSWPDPPITSFWRFSSWPSVPPPLAADDERPWSPGIVRTIGTSVALSLVGGDYLMLASAAHAFFENPQLRPHRRRATSRLKRPLSGVPGLVLDALLPAPPARSLDVNANVPSQLLRHHPEKLKALRHESLNMRALRRLVYPPRQASTKPDQAHSTQCPTYG
jgi:hypothetical protein